MASTLITDYMGKGLASARPTSPPIGSNALAFWLSTDANKISWWDGSAWQDSSSVWRSGSGAPSSGLGFDGDLYVNTANGDLYQKASGSWSLLLNLKGPTGSTGATGAAGAAGTPGSQIYNGVGAPSSGTGIDGDYYLDSATGDLYLKASGSWSVLLTIVGPTGPAGPAGAGSTVEIDDEGSAITLSVASMNFVGAGVTATASGSAVTVTIPGSSASIATDSDVTLTSIADGDRLHYSSGSSKWVNGREPYTLGAFVPGTMTGSQVCLYHKFAIAVSFPGNFGSTSAAELSYASALALATGSTVFNIDKCLAANDPTVSGNWSTIGTITYSASGHTGALATTSGTSKSFAQGDKLRVIAPSSPDATLANVTFTLAGDR